MFTGGDGDPSCLFGRYKSKSDFGVGYRPEAGDAGPDTLRQAAVLVLNLRIHTRAHMIRKRQANSSFL